MKVKVVFQTPKGWKLETLKLEGGDGDTYGGISGSKTNITHAAWTQDFINGPPSKERPFQQLPK